MGYTDAGPETVYYLAHKVSKLKAKFTKKPFRRGEKRRGDCMLKRNNKLK